MSAKIADVLRQSKAVINTPYKWCKGHTATITRGGEGKVVRCCAIEAINSAAGAGSESADAAEIALKNAIIEEFADDLPKMEIGPKDHAEKWSPFYIITNFNDYSRTRHKDVMRAYDRAIADEERSA